jgi:hypothetical protein
MRVSSQYNKIAVPYLYEYITIGPGDRSPFAATTENMIRRPIQRKSAEKMSNLGMVKGVAISLPYVDDGDWNLPSQGLQVDWLRISERRCQEYLDDCCHPIVTGKALNSFDPINWSSGRAIRNLYSVSTGPRKMLPSSIYRSQISISVPHFHRSEWNICKRR